MKFKEIENDFIILPKYENCFIYFLLKDENVVYVGQTNKGLSRPYSHKDKDFNKIIIKYCKKDELDYYEDKYITKYKPIYNKQVNYKYNYTFNMIKGLIRKNTTIKNFNLTDLKKLIKTLKINVNYEFGILTIRFEDYEKIYNYIKGGYYGK